MTLAHPSVISISQTSSRSQGSFASWLKTLDYGYRQPWSSDAEAEGARRLHLR